ncbi:ferritin family protein [Thermococcus sp. MAR1]|uniref:ferritin family protein n=1 Tax=Thermococcus sp. MAR1 TaxID=1638263 RepID=UPI001438D355|nr:ferritin family protein [Thermococcus sp. MAR1]NJE11360.1 hypothetical protein [Thermococcus sp. MAR1]
MPTPIESFMAAGDTFEEIKKVLEDVSKSPLPEVLAYLVKSEEYSVRIYAILRDTLPHGYGRIKFGDFVERKIKSEEKLRRIARKLFPDLNIEVSETEWSRIFLERKSGIRTVGDYLEVLRTAMELEELGEKVYSYLAQRLSGYEERNLMKDLAAVSRKNYEALKEEFEKLRGLASKKAFEDFFDELVE